MSVAVAPMMMIDLIPFAPLAVAAILTLPLALKMAPSAGEAIATLGGAGGGLVVPSRWSQTLSICSTNTDCWR
jgi:hypothetical protein